VDDERLAEPGANGNLTGESPAPPVGLASPPPAYEQSPYMAYPPVAIAPPPAKPRHTGRNFLIAGLIAVLILAALGGGAVMLNASLVSTYSPEKAVLDYLAAQKRGDVAFMTANANYLKGDGSYSEYFGETELRTMMSYPQNTDISNVLVKSTFVNDSETRTVTATMTWGTHQVNRTYTVHKDATRVHLMFYNSWRIDIPYVSIHIGLPNQPGAISVDGLTVPNGASTDNIQVIQGFHQVKMASNGLYDAASADADGIDGSPNIFFTGKVSSVALAAAAKLVKKAIATCASSRYVCLNKVYHAPSDPSFIYYMTVPGYGEVFYTSYKYTLTKDPTINMKLVVDPAAGKVLVSGTCAYTMTVNGSKPYYLKGTWKGSLTESAGDFSGYDLLFDCLKSKA